ncbi:MAG TPA: outer membrane protein transport protein [Polyangia bacterium]|jgi:long-chain fatty acid transport protein|nr:outer membrane protein transport protein [Polyangia bacterium]
MRTHVIMAIALGLCGLGASRAAHAGGFEIPDNGTEALGRGGAFVAKADDGTALEYNIAGLARQRGTRITLNGNFLFHDTQFTRAGTYASDPSTPGYGAYGGLRYPTIHDSNRIGALPFIAVTTDFGWFKRWTFGFGLYTPSSIAQHNYNVGPRAAGATDDPPAQVTLPGGVVAPGPGRYDVARTNLLIVYPTLAAAVRLARWIDIGAAFQIVYSRLDLANASVTPFGGGTCGPTGESPGCDAYAEIRTTGVTAAALASVMLHPVRWLDLGGTFRTPIDINTKGTLHATPPPIFPTPLPDQQATFRTRMPLWFRLGARFVSRYHDGTERFDIEGNFVYEHWSSEKAAVLRVENFTTPIDPNNPYVFTAAISHNYRNTAGLRLGGAYNFWLGERTRLIGRLGYYYDSSATRNADTRLDFNTFQKYGFTAGLGIRWSGLTVNVAYAYVYSPSRTVTDSRVLALSSFNGSNLDPSRGDPVVTVGNGRYEQRLQIFSIGVTISPGDFKRKQLPPN